MIEQIPLYSIGLIGMLLILFFASIRDIQYHRIDRNFVLVFLLIVMFYNTLNPGVEKTLSFFISLGLFGFITLVTKGGFGIGDTLILGCIGWWIGDLKHLQYYLIVLVFATLILEAYFIIKNHEQRGLKKIYNNTKFVPVNELKPGMILAKDYFMKGLTEKDITAMKQVCNSTVRVKFAYPFIPVIFLSFLVFEIIRIAYYL